MSNFSPFTITVADTIGRLRQPFTMKDLAAVILSQSNSNSQTKTPQLSKPQTLAIYMVLTRLKIQGALRATVHCGNNKPSQYLRLPAFPAVLATWTRELEASQTRADRNAQLLKMHLAENLSYSEIVRRTGLAMGTVASRIHQARINAGLKDKAPSSGSVQNQKHPSKITPELREQIFALRKQGLKGRDIADRTAVPIGTIYAVLNGHMARAADLREPLDPPTPHELAWRQFRSNELALKDDHFYSAETFIT